MFFNNSNRKYVNDNSNYTYVKEVIDKGMNINKADLSNDTLQIWLEYARKVLEICSPQNTNIQLDFLKLINEVQFSSLYPYQKLNIYLKYLIEIARYI